jgi:hypothetical protein
VDAGGDDHLDVVDAVIGQQSSTTVSTRSRTSGRFIGGSGSEMSSIAIVTFIPGFSSA